MWTSEKQTYDEVLQDFKERFNGNPRARKLTKGWDRDVVLDATDTSARRSLVIRDQTVVDVLELESIDGDADKMVHLQAEEDVLLQIFSGRYNPATALGDGALAVYSAERDKVKLEALAMVIWRLG